MNQVKPKKTIRPSKQYGSLEEGLHQLKEDPGIYAVTTKLRPIGNSKGVILNNRIMEEAGISPDEEVVIQAIHGNIIISKTSSPTAVNTDLSTWDAQFKRAIKAHGRSTDDLWQGIQNKFDEEEWT